MQRKGDSRISLVALFSLAFVLAFSHIQGFLHPFSFQYFTLNFSSIPSLNFTNFSCFWVYLLLTSNMYYYIFLKLCRIFYMILGCYIPLPYLHTLYSDIFNNKYFVIYKFIITIHFFFQNVPSGIQPTLFGVWVWHATDWAMSATVPPIVSYMLTNIIDCLIS